MAIDEVQTCLTRLTLGVTGIRTMDTRARAPRIATARHAMRRHGAGPISTAATDLRMVMATAILRLVMTSLVMTTSASLRGCPSSVGAHRKRPCGLTSLAGTTAKSALVCRGRVSRRLNRLVSPLRNRPLRARPRHTRLCPAPASQPVPARRRLDHLSSVRPTTARKLARRTAGRLAPRRHAALRPVARRHVAPRLPYRSHDRRVPVHPATEPRHPPRPERLHPASAPRRPATA